VRNFASNGLDNLQTSMNNALIKRLPKGVIVAWYGSVNTIPSGWALCDGQNGTPDLIDRFVLGGPVAKRLQYGGDDNFTLEENNLPTHCHALFYKKTEDGEERTYAVVATRTLQKAKDKGGGGVRAFDTGGHEYMYYTGNTGNGAKVEYMPKYYQLCYIMKL
jgi:microcystin-dependent protein